jgi:hypothetical protein
MVTLMAEVGVEQNSTIIFPAHFMTTAQEAITAIREAEQREGGSDRQGR